MMTTQKKILPAGVTFNPSSFLSQSPDCLKPGLFFGLVTGTDTLIQAWIKDPWFIQCQYKMRTIFTLIVATLFQNIIAQEKELLIIGTMHEVPSIVSHSYRPLLKYAKKYKPEAIFVEDIRPDDTLSLKNYIYLLLFKFRKFLTCLF